MVFEKELIQAILDFKHPDDNRELVIYFSAKGYDELLSERIGYQGYTVFDPMKQTFFGYQYYLVNGHFDHPLYSLYMLDK